MAEFGKSPETVFIIMFEFVCSLTFMVLKKQVSSFNFSQIALKNSSNLIFDEFLKIMKNAHSVMGARIRAPNQSFQCTIYAGLPTFET